MLTDQFGSVEDAVAGPQPRLRTVYRVHADRSYDVTRPVPAGGPFACCFRTLSGGGRVEVDGAETAEVGPGTVLLACPERVMTYRCAGASWDFWWYEFEIEEGLMLPREEVLDLPGGSDEDLEARRCMELLRELSPSAHQLASARFGTILADWIDRWSRTQAPRHPHGAAIGRVQRLMTQDVGSPSRVAELAKSAHLSERRFRTVFKELVGCTPKAYQVRVRLDAAAQMLQMTPLTVSQIAARLGFSSLFHLSKDFKHAYGVPPSEYRRRPARR